MLELDSPVNVIEKIGPKYKKLLENLEIYTVEDLLYHFPFRYDDFSQVKEIKDVVPGENATIRGILGPVKNIFTKYGKRLTQAKVVDDSGSITLTWFNSHYLKKSLHEGKEYNFSGKINTFSGKVGLVAPTFELVGEKTLNTGRLVPVYPETAGVSSKWLRDKINSALSSRLAIQEFLPHDLLLTEQLPTIKDALEKFHFPENLEQANTAKKRFQLEELLLELIKVEQRKEAWTQNSEAPIINSLIHADKIDVVIENLAFNLTDSQQQAIEEIKEELKQSAPMNRLLEGDVGSGKTIVAVISAYIACLNGFDTLYMAPTEILAKQHYETFKKFLGTQGVNINLVTGNAKAMEREGPSITIGTHALLYRDGYSNVGLVVIDEQHRFGVEQRTKLANINDEDLTPHLLTMTATPIPRTLALTLYGDLEISQIEPIPEKDRVIKTKVVWEKGREKAFEWIKNKNEQTFIVCPFIQESEHENFENVKAATAEFVRLQKGVFKDKEIGLLHGKMKSEEKKQVVEDFDSGKIQILVSTPVIEVGIDIPEATIMVIESAERYGLASLHQLRGRVGRGEKPGTCLIFMSDNNRTAHSRLKNLETINDGLKLAEIDLGLRGSGDIYGTMQSGFKRFKVARLSDIELLEKAKKYAAEIFPDLDKYPNLKTRIFSRDGEYVGNN